MFDTHLKIPTALWTLLAVASACDPDLAADETEGPTDGLAGPDDPGHLADEPAELREEAPAASAGVTVNAIDFMRNRDARKRLLLDPSRSYQPPGHGCTPEVSYFELWNVKIGDLTHNAFYYVKSPDGRLWELYNSDASEIWLERDTSWPATDAGGGSGAGYDAKPWGSLTWAANGWAEGSQLPFSTRIVGFYWDPSLPNACRYDATPTPSFEMSGYKTVSYHPAKDWSGDVGQRDSIAVDYYLPTWVVDHVEMRLGERHWYARDQGWVGWEHFDREDGQLEQRCVWNRDGGAPTLPKNPCGADLGDRALPFLGASTQMTSSYGDWDFCHHKATCREGHGVQGLSRALGGAGPQRTALCAQAQSAYHGAYRAVLQVPGDQRRAQRHVGGAPDWDYGHWKLECGPDEYVAGVSQGAQACGTGDGQFHGVLCAAGVAGRLSQTCTTRAFDGGDDRATQSSGDWDPGAYKAECGPRQYLAGVSVHPSTSRVHALLCCDRS